MGGEHGSLFVHEESPSLHLPEPPQTRFLTLPEHQVCPVHTFQPLDTLQQVTPCAGTGATRAQPALPAAVQWLSHLAVVQIQHCPHLATQVHTGPPVPSRSATPSGDGLLWPLTGGEHLAPSFLCAFSSLLLMDQDLGLVRIAVASRL